VLHVVPSTAAQRAGIEAGDVITLAGEIEMPSPGQVRGAYASSEAGHGVLLALTRGTTHKVVVLLR
jgi:S1-C subfamily serine protease